MKEEAIRLEKLKKLFKLQQYIRDFFTSKNFIDVQTPPMVQNPGMETHIHPFQIKSAHHNKDLDLFLHTSPEFHMKELLSIGFEKIFNLSYSFRDEPEAPHHRPQFLMLEWYRRDEFYTKIMSDTQELFKFCINRFINDGIEVKRELRSFTPVKKTIQEIFKETLNIDILNYLDKDSLSKLIRDQFSQVPLPSEAEHHKLSWDDYYFLLFLNEVEPKLKKYPFILLYNFPKQLSALSTICSKDERVCERFEVYSFGIELCNCFNELTDLSKLKDRFETQAKEKKNLYKYELPEPKEFYNTMRSLPKSSGIALGVERLLLSITETENPFFY